jgi:hypothetical protein
MVSTWLEGVGLTLPQLIGFVLTIVASFFAARFGASESRRQHQEKVRLETLTAAGELIHSLHIFARRLESILYDISNERSSRGNVGKAHSSLSEAKFLEHVFELAAKLGEANLAALIRLAGARQLAEQSISASFEYLDQDGAVSGTQAWAAPAYYSDIWAVESDCRNRARSAEFQSSIEKERLAEEANQRIEDLNVRQLPHRMARSLSFKSMPPTSNTTS